MTPQIVRVSSHSDCLPQLGPLFHTIYICTLTLSYSGSGSGSASGSGFWIPDFPDALHDRLEEISQGLILGRF